MHVPTILHITSRADWVAARALGRYEASSLLTQGYIHFSTPAQVIRTANFLFTGQNDLVVLRVESDRVIPDIRYENCEGGTDLFPHIYGPLNLDAVVSVIPLEADHAGVFQMPDELLPK